MRILQAYKVYPPDVHGGIAEVMAQIAGLSTCGDQVAILVARSRGLPRTYQTDGAAVHAVGSLGELMSMPIAPTFPLALCRAAARCDVLALHAPFPLNDLALLHRLPDHVAVVLHWHAEIVGRHLAMRFIAPLIKRTVRRADKIIVTGRAMVEMSPFLATVDQKCVVVPYGIDVDYWSELDGSQQQKVRSLKSKHPRLIVSVGRLVPYKGYPVLIRAMRDIDGELIIVGDGGERPQLEALARQMGVADRVHLQGYMSRDLVKVYLHAARVFALASVSAAEAFGIVQVEAMACGLPVVNTLLPTAAPSVARHAIEGLSVQPNNAGALAQAINSILDDQSLALKMSQSGRIRSRSEYAKDVFLKRIRDVYIGAKA